MPTRKAKSASLLNFVLTHTVLTYTVLTYTVLTYTVRAECGPAPIARVSVFNRASPAAIVALRQNTIRVFLHTREDYPTSGGKSSVNLLPI